MVKLRDGAEASCENTLDNNGGRHEITVDPAVMAQNMERVEDCIMELMG